MVSRLALLLPPRFLVELLETRVVSRGRLSVTRMPVLVRV